MKLSFMGLTNLRASEPCEPRCELCESCEPCEPCEPWYKKYNKKKIITINNCLSLLVSFFDWSGRSIAIRQPMMVITDVYWRAHFCWTEKCFHRYPKLYGRFDRVNFDRWFLLQFKNTNGLSIKKSLPNLLCLHAFTCLCCGFWSDWERFRWVLVPLLSLYVWGDIYGKMYMGRYIEREQWN